MGTENKSYFASFGKGYRIIRGADILSLSMQASSNRARVRDA